MNLKLEVYGFFLFFWCGSCEGLDLGREMRESERVLEEVGRECVKKWGYHCYEDICWGETNNINPKNNQHLGAQEYATMYKTHRSTV